MKRQLLKGLAMLMAIMALALVTAVASANGQSRTAKANVPFGFIVGDQNLPAGAYTVASVTAAGDALRILSDDSKNSALRVTSALGGKSDQAKLVFHRYGQRYFLAEVWTTEADGRQLMKSRQERAIQKELSSIALSKPASSAYEIVEIAVALQ